MDFEHAAALALADDHETQERVWADAREPWQRTPRELRAAITITEIDASRSHLAKFVGIEVYEAAGGRVRRDLFSDAANAGFIADPDLLHRLATERLVAASQEIAREGWSWVETRTRRDYNEMFGFARLHSVSREPTPDEQAELDALIVKRDAASDALNAYYDTDGEPDEDEQERLEDAANAASDAVDLYGERFETFDADDMKRAGAFVVIDSDGQLSVERGLIRREDAKKLAGGANAVAGGAVGVVTPKKAKPLHGEKLCRRLTAHRTAAIQVELARQPNAALAVLMSRMIPVVFEDVYAREFAEYAIRIEAHTSRDRLLIDADDMADCVAWKEIEGERGKWARMLPERTAELLPWLLAQEPDLTSNLFAFCVAATLDGTSDADRAHPINELADLLNVDLSYYWKPTRASYFDHVSKARIVDVVAAAVSPEAAADLQGMKKSDAAAAAELRMADSGWLPEVLTNREIPERRSYSYINADDDADDADEDDETAATEEEPQSA
jgi:ParB family transcriptional regulator, chromosome partitioning protein